MLENHWHTRHSCQGSTDTPALLTPRLRQTVTWGSILLGIAGCSVWSQPPVSPDPTASPAVQQQPAAARPQAAADIAVLPATGSQQQQALIDAINRPGRVVSFGGFTEDVPTPEVIEGDDVVELNYEQAELRLVMEELANALDVSLVIDPAISTLVSIRTAADRPLQRDDIWPLMRLLSRDAGLVLERAGDVYNLRQSASNLASDIVTADTLGDSSAARVMQVTPLRYVTTEAVIQAIEPLLAPNGGVSQLGTGNLLLLSGSGFDLERVNQLLLLIDADPFVNQGIHLYRLSNAKAEEVAEELAEILQLIEGMDPAYQVKGITRINALLVTAPAARGFDEISRWVEILDADSQEQVEQLFMYRVKNLVAAELAQTLSDVFDEDEELPFPPGLMDFGGSGPPPLFPDTGAAADSEATTTDAAETAAFLSIPPAPGSAAVAADLTVKIVADEPTNSLLIRSTARDYRQLLTTISQLDVVPLQVMVNAVIAQITLNDETKFGVDWSRIAADAAMNPISTRTSTDFVPSLGGLLFSKGFLDGSARVEATLEAIAVNNDVRLLARPSLTVSNNQEGEIQIGAEVPVEAGQALAAGGVSTTNIQYRPTGIELYITPQINDDGVVNLIIRQVLSSVDSGASGVNSNPVFNNQEISTTVVVRNGENVVLGGLIQNDVENLNTGIPGLNRIPLLGNLFSYQQRNLERRELFIVLRPEIINLNDPAGVQYDDILARFELASELFEDLRI